jgi:thioesterase domain-containing protein/acyl carrier protein
LLQRHQISILWLTAGLFHQMVDWNLKALSPVQTLLAGGDVLSPRHVRRVVEQLPTCQLINGYGPTENTTFTCCFPIPPAGDFGDSVPLGHPIAHTQVYALDAQQHLVPKGVFGELCIGGLGLAREYHRQPDMTAEKFIPHPFSPVAGARLYRSGDLARYRQDGTLQFLGRRDHQVKIRGYRIECGEIETILRTHSAVREVAVLPREDSVENKRLVAYIVPESGSVPHISEFRDFLSRSLPVYMIPASFVFLDEFPLTSNGKIDRSNLPVEDQSSSQEKSMYVSPRNLLESQLTKIWELVLGRQPIGVTDNFFTLGGESLKAVRLCSEMERALRKKIPVPLIFHAQTIEQLAKKIGQGEEDKSPSLMVPIQPTGSNPPIFCFGFGSNFRQYLKDYPNQPLYMFLNQGHDGRPVLNTTVEKIAALCLKEIRTVQPKGPYHLAGYSFGGIVVYEMAQQLRKQGETTGLLALVDPTTSRPKPASIPRRTQLSHLLESTTHEGEKRPLHFKILHISHAIFTKAVEAVHWRWNKLQTTSWNKLRKMFCHVYFRFGYPLPTYLRRFYRDIVVRKAASQYTPQNYSAQIVIFQTKNFVETYWSTLCSEVVQVYDLPCKHHEIYLDGPHAPSLLHQLLNHLEKAKKIQA